jgi:hypothetical protein
MPVDSLAKRPGIGVRWTIGDVSEDGWQTLRLSVLRAFRVFGSNAAYAVSVNSVPLPEARWRVGGVLPEVAWPAVREWNCQ